MSAQLERALKFAERKLLDNSRRTPTDLLDLYRRFLKHEEHRLKVAHREGESGRDFVKRRSELYTVVLRHMFQNAMESARKSHNVDPAESSIDLCAVGGFGRGELCPHSDIDILFLYQKPKGKKETPPFVTDVVEQVLYILWDIGLKVGHASRTVDEAILHGQEDLQTRTALLEIRLISGNEELFQDFQRRFHRLCVKGKETPYLAWRMEDQQKRHAKNGDTVFLQEPQIKNGCGGLRDYHNLIWMAQVRGGITTTAGLVEAGWLTQSDRKKIDHAHDFLLRVRNELHYQQKHLVDQLTLKSQGTIANAFHYGQKTILRRIEAFMRDYYQHTRNMFLITGLVARRMAGATSQRRRLWSLIPAKARGEEKIDGFVIADGEIHFQSPSILSEEHPRFVRAFQLMQQRDAVLSPELQNLLTNKVHTLEYKFIWLDEVREMMHSILSKKGRVGRILRGMHEAGLLGRIIPEFRPLTCMVQHEFYHRYTADEHTLVCIEQLDRVFDDEEDPFPKYRPLLIKCEQPEILYLALVLHDVGKAVRGRNHSEASAQLAARYARRSKIRGRRLQNLIFLVDHHMTLSEFAQRRNLDDPATIREFAFIVQDEVRLDMLMLLTFADGRGTGGANNWTSWKELLVWRLYHLTRDMLLGEEEFLRRRAEQRKEVIKHVRASVSKTIDDDEVSAHFHFLPDNYVTGLNETLLRTHVELVHSFFMQQVALDANVLRPLVHWEDRVNEGHSEVTIVTWNRDQLFAKLCGAFSLAELNILSANIFTREDDIVIDTFRVCTDRQEAVTDKRDSKAFEKFLGQTLENPDFDMASALNEVRSMSRRAGYDEDAFPTALRFDNQTSPSFTLLHVQTPDRIGLLYQLSYGMAELGLQIQHALITTEKGAALDTFYLLDAKGSRITTEAAQTRILSRLRELITPAR
jgi:[protein-PII] uridylyltransferase